MNLTSKLYTPKMSSFCLKLKVVFYHECCFDFYRNKYVYETVFAIGLAVLVSVLGYWLLLEDFYTDFWIFVFCFVLAGCQFSLLKVSKIAIVWKLYHVTVVFVCHNLAILLCFRAFNRTHLRQPT